MTATAPKTLLRRFLILAVIGLGVGLTAGFLFRGNVSVEPPIVDLSHADEEVAELVQSTRKDVLAAPRDAHRWGRLGMVLRAHDFADAANACFAQAERLNPRDPAWPYYRGLTLVLTDPTEGLACLRRAVERMPEGELMPRFRLVEVLLEQNQLDEAERHLAVSEKHPRGQLLRARLESARKNDNTALLALADCMADPHTRRQAHQLAAEVYERLGNVNKAEEVLAQLRRLPMDLPWTDPYVAEVESLAVGKLTRLKLAQALRQQERWGDAVVVLEGLAQAHPGDMDVWVTLGETQQLKRDFASAERAYLRAIAIDPKHLAAWFGLGMVRLERRPREAADAFRAVIEQKPDHTVAHYLMGVCLKKSGNREGAHQAFEAALRCQPDHEPTLKALAMLRKVEP